MQSRSTILQQLLDLSDQFRRQGDLEQAATVYQQILGLEPNHVAVLHRLAVVRYLQQRLPDALEQIDKAAAKAPGDASILSNRGLFLSLAERAEDALASYEAALALRPDFIDALNGRGAVLLQLERRDEALASYSQAISAWPESVQALNGQGNVLLQLHRPEEALDSYNQALELRPDFVEALSNRGVAYSEMKRPADALADYDAALALAPDYAEALNNRAIALSDLGRYTEALLAYERAIAARPDNAETHDNKGVLLTQLGRFDEAATAAEQAIRLAPQKARPYYNLSICRRFQPGDPYLANMEMLAASGTADPGGQTELLFALGKAHADLGDPATSFRHLLAANALKRSRTAYDEDDTLGVFKRTTAAYAPERLRDRQGRGDPSDVPVFVIGMPRSGSTLVEQILASHPQVFGVGETDDFANAVLALEGPASQALLDPEAALSIPDAQLRALGADYLARLADKTPAAATRVVDKTIANFRFAGLIHLALPNAKIIHVQRDPLDICLSCFSRLFVGALSYTYDLAELGRYYRGYEALMAHWRSGPLQTAMLEVRYEEIVADLEGQARRMIAHCGLDWDSRCLDFHLTERQVKTASATQVRQPIYGGSVARWRAYEAFLEPLIEALGADTLSGKRG